MFQNKGHYYPYPVAAQIQDTHGPVTVTRYVVVTPGATALTNRAGGTRLFKTLAGARSHAWRLNNPGKVA